MTDAPPRDARRGFARLATILFTILFVAPVVTVAIVAMQRFAPEGSVLEIDMRPTGGTAAQFFWTSTSLFTEKESALIPLHQRPGEYERLRFALPQQPLDFIRYDFLNGPGEVLIRSMRVLDADGRIVRDIDPMLMLSTPQVQSIARVRGSGDVRIATIKDANDPMLLIRPEWTTAPPSWRSLRFVTPLSLAWIGIAVAAIIAAACGMVAYDFAKGPFTLGHTLWLLALFFVVLTAKLALIDQFPMPVPFWDQWDGEAHALYLPYANHGLNWRVMFALHNEHRIFFSRLLAMVLLAINGQWDPQLQMFVNAGLHSLTAVIIAAMAWIAAARKWLAVIVTVVALAFAPPFALENTLAGFQSAFYFLVLFSVLSLWLLGMHEPGTRPWFLGWLCAFCSIFTVAGGLLMVGAIAGLLLLRVAAEPARWRSAALTVLALAVVAAAGYAALSPPLAYHAYLKAESMHAFGAALARNLAFPWITAPRPSVLLWLPMMAVALGVIVRRFRATTLEHVSLALGAWVIVQCAAIAYSRGVGGTAPASRYLDTLSFGFIVNSLALLTLIDRQPTRRRVLGMTAALAIWVIVGAVGVTQLSQRVVATDGRTRLGWMQEHIRNVRHFIISGDAASLAEKRGPFEVPYYNSQMLGGWLGHPYVRSILPAVIREPIPLDAAAGTQPTFGRTASPKDLLPVWDSYGSMRAKSLGRFDGAPTRCAGSGYVRFEIAGDLRDSAMRLALKDSVTGAETRVRPPIGTGSGWIATSVRCPEHPFTVAAEDQSTTKWFAFRQPAESAWASVLAERAIQQWRILAIVTGLLVVFAAASGVKRKGVVGRGKHEVTA